MSRGEDVAYRALERLTQDPNVFGSWLEPDEIRSRARRRRVRKRGGFGGAILMVVVLTSTLIVLPTNGSELRIAARSGSAVQLVSDRQLAGPQPSSALATRVARSEQQFAVSLLQQLSGANPTSTNIVVSPSSLAIALSMLELGAKGATQAQMAQVLGTPDLTSQNQAAGWAALSAELAAAATSGGTALESANSLWLQKGLVLDPTFMSDLSRYFASGVWQADFAHNPAAAVNSLNNWVAQKTRGHITSLFGPGQIDQSTGLILANAEYFKAMWQQPFGAQTTDGSFVTAGGATLTVPFLRSNYKPLEVKASTGSGADVVQLPYVGGQFAALVVMPTSGSLNQLLGRLTPKLLDGLVSGLRATTLDLSMPRFSLSDKHDLASTLQSLGMRSAFHSDADLSGVGPAGLGVQGVVQKATLDVTPWGTEATAATGISVATSARSGEMSITIDHPFLFLIRDVKSGAILFASQVADPSRA